MAVYDKELIINGEAVRSPEQQVYKNMKDIQALKEKIKNTYSTDVTTLTSSSVSVATANVDGLGTATEGWLLDPNGLLFKITANDGTTTTLKYYSDLKGPQGEDGAAVNIDDNITSLTKVWSSQKTNNEITGLIDDSTPSATKVWSSSKVSSLLSDGIYWTSSEPTLVGTEYRISGDIYCGEDIINPSGTPGLTDNVLKEGDMIAYVDNDGKIASIWYYISGSSPKVVAKVGDIGGGKQSYQHNVSLKIETTSVYAEIVLQITNDSNVAFTKDSLATYATYSADRPINNIIANGFWFDKTNTKQYRVNKLYNNNGLQWYCTDCNTTTVAGSTLNPIYANFTYTIIDSIIPS